MALSIEQVHQWVKEWAVRYDPEIEVDVLQPHDNPRDRGEIVPVRLRRHGYQMTVGIPEGGLSESPLPRGTQEILERVVRLLVSMKTRGLRRE